MHKWVFLTVLAVVFAVHTASATPVRVISVEEQVRWAIAAWRSGLSHSRVRVKQLGPPLELKVVPSVVLSLRDDAGNSGDGLCYEGSSRGPTHEMLELQRGTLEQQRRDQWFNHVME
jgi:hypothetical protein